MKSRTENVAIMILVEKLPIDYVIPTIEPDRTNRTLLGKQRYKAMLRLGTILMQEEWLTPSRTVHRQRNNRVKGKVTLSLINPPVSSP